MVSNVDIGNKFLSTQELAAPSFLYFARFCITEIQRNTEYFYFIFASPESLEMSIQIMFDSILISFLFFI